MTDLLVDNSFAVDLSVQVSFVEDYYFVGKVDIFNFSIVAAVVNTLFFFILIIFYFTSQYVFFPLTFFDTHNIFVLNLHFVFFRLIAFLFFIFPFGLVSNLIFSFFQFTLIFAFLTILFFFDIIVPI